MIVLDPPILPTELEASGFFQTGLTATAVSPVDNLTLNLSVTPYGIPAAGDAVFDAMHSTLFPRNNDERRTKAIIYLLRFAAGQNDGRHLR